MPNLKLTQIAVDRLRAPTSGRVEYWDTQLPGFGLRVYAARPGHDPRKSWQVLYRVNGRPVRETLGTLATIPKVDEARERARASMQKASTGIHPAEERRRAEARERRAAEREAARQRHTVAAVLDRYIDEFASRRWRAGTLKEVRRAFEADVKPALGRRPVAEITRRDVRELIDAIVARGRAPHAHHVLAYLRPALSWAVDREIIEANPAAGVPDPDPRRREARTRDRYLDDDEIRLLWGACDELGWPFGPMFRLLLLTGQRRDELAAARWCEFDLGEKRLWTLPRERVKNDKAHLVHLSPLAVEIIETLPKIGENGFVFTTTGDSPVSGFGRARERLAAKMLDLKRAELRKAAAAIRDPSQRTAAARHAEAATIGHFTIHDLRRSSATGMARIGIAHHVLDRVLNHTAGKISGVAAIYNRFDYLAERKAALEAWSRRVDALVRLQSTANVVPIAAPAQRGIAV